ncbi:uncharacterized protein LOC134573494 [Pelobates fuscus]|uniref:uncharacterized protein LOC134573494 n=1 Tax=Pelobates fuscus TaxID=191477 RepID=UPI002FE45137
MRTLFFWLSLSFFFASLYGSPTDCNEGYDIPTDLTKVNGLWNVKVIAAFKEAESVNVINYLYAEVSVTETEANITSSNPIYNLELETTRNRRIDDQKLSLSYMVRSTEGEVYTLKFWQSNPESLIAIQDLDNETKVAFLYSRGTSLPESEVEHFKKWSNCKKLVFLREFEIGVNYALECHGLFEHSTHLDDIVDKATWGLVAKSSSIVDINYLKRILYEGKLEISKTGDVYSVLEILTLPGGTHLSEKKYTKGEKDSDVSISTYKTEEGLLVVGVRSKDFRTLFLASKSSKAKQSVLEKFERQAQCFETNHIYHIPGSKIPENEKEACTKVFDQLLPVILKESIGKWSLTISAYEKKDPTLSDVLLDYAWMEIDFENGRPHMSYVSINEGSLFRMGRDNIELEDTNGLVTFKDRSTSLRSTMYRVSADCIMFSTLSHNNPDGMVFLFCRSTQVPGVDIKKFVDYAFCMKLNYIVIRKHSSLGCLDLPHEIQILEDQKIAGKWNVVAVASSIMTGEHDLSPEMHFNVLDEKITVTGRNSTLTVDRKEGNRLHYTADGAVMEFRFYELTEDLLIAWNGSPTSHQIFLTLLSKSDRVDSADIDRFKHFASCLTVPVVFIKE